MKEYVIEGIVQYGKKRGKKLGFPTANVSLKANIPQGIYVSHTTFDTITYQSLTFIGNATTFDETVYQAETYILNFKRDLYGKTIHIRLLKKLRENEKFDSFEDLIEQMKKDEKEALKYFALFK